MTSTRNLVEMLRAEADKRHGLEGAAYGAFFGVASALAAVEAKSQEPTMPVLLAGAAMGIVYGLTEKEQRKGPANK